MFVCRKPEKGLRGGGKALRAPAVALWKTKKTQDSLYSLSTAATSVSSQSWRSQTSKYTTDSQASQMPSNVKCKSPS